MTHRKTVTGRVVSCKMDKTIVVEVARQYPHPLYQKIIKRTAKRHAHDADNQCQLGDIVSIAESRPISKTKAWVLVEILNRREGGDL